MGFLSRACLGRGKLGFFTACVDGINQSVRVFAADTVDQLSVGSLP